MAQKIKGSIYFKLYVAFFKIGLFTFGGGYAMLPMLRKEVVDKHKWATDEEMLDYFAIGQSTPGIIAINTSTFIGVQEAGVFGALFSTLGMVTPSLIIIISSAKFFETFADNIYIAKAFMGIRVIVVVLILNAVIRMAKKSIKNWLHVILFVSAFVLIMFTPLSPIYIVIASGLVGVLVQVMDRGAEE